MNEEQKKEYYNLVIKEFKGLKKKISMMPASMKRTYLYSNYANLMAFMGRIGINITEDLIELDDSDKFDRLYEKRKLEDINELGSNIETLQDIFNEVISYCYEKNLYIANFSSRTKINQRNIGYILHDFFASLDPMIYKTFLNCQNNGNLVFTSVEGAGGITFPLLFEQSSKVIVSGDLNYLDSYHTLVHEMGHVYHTELSKNNECFHGFDATCEVVSMLFEKLFCRYLKDHHYYPIQTDNLIKTERLANLNLLVHCDLICDILKKDLGAISFDDLSIICPLDAENIMELLRRDCQYIVDFDGSLNLYNFTYAIGDIISSYFYQKIMEDKEKGLRELKDFAANSERLTLEEIIDRYMMDLTPIMKYINEQLEVTNVESKIKKKRKI